MDESGDSEQKFGELSKAIAEAVMNSKKVKKVVADIQKKEKICPQSFMVLVLKMQVLADSLNLDLEDPSLEKKRAKRPRKKSSKEQAQYIDGRKLSKNEIAFEDFFREGFDTDQWLKKNGLEF
ncbi:MAG: hypothetical protein VYC17_01655 [Nitrospinota bacterium]|nr:hypothetical protein [Nitrospinota bacterium]